MGDVVKRSLSPLAPARATLQLRESHAHAWPCNALIWSLALGVSSLASACARDTATDLPGNAWTVADPGRLSTPRDASPER